MRFGPVPPDGAEGAMLAHGLSVGGRRLRKGVLLGPDEVAALCAAGVAEVTVARPDPGDVDEATAATRLAGALAGGAGLRPSRAFTGRVNLHADAAGVLEVDAARVTTLNLTDPGITLATAAPWARVAAGAVVATVKIIPYAVPGAALDRAVAGAAGALRLHPVRLRDAGLILTEVPGQGARLADKARRAMETRLDRLGMTLRTVRRVPHARPAIAAALAEVPGDIVLMVMGAATADVRDAGPAALADAGGRLDRFGLPVDPGNLSFWGRLDGRPVLGMPGTARSPVASGVDRVLERLVCGLPLPEADVAAMGVGGLGRDIPSRGQPRETPARGQPREPPPPPRGRTRDPGAP